MGVYENRDARIVGFPYDQDANKVPDFGNHHFGKSLLGASWYLLTNYNCTYNHFRALEGLASGV